MKQWNNVTMKPIIIFCWRLVLFRLLDLCLMRLANYIHFYKLILELFSAHEGWLKRNWWQSIQWDWSLCFFYFVRWAVFHNHFHLRLFVNKALPFGASMTSFALFTLESKREINKFVVAFSIFGGLRATQCATSLVGWLVRWSFCVFWAVFAIPPQPSNTRLL